MRLDELKAEQKSDPVEGVEIGPTILDGFRRIIGKILGKNPSNQPPDQPKVENSDLDDLARKIASGISNIHYN